MGENNTPRALKGCGEKSDMQILTDKSLLFAHPILLGTYFHKAFSWCLQLPYKSGSVQSPSGCFVLKIFNLKIMSPHEKVPIFSD